MPEKKLRVDLLAIPESSASVLYGMYELFAAVGHDWPLLMEGRPGMPLIDARIVAARPEPMQVANGIWIHPNGGFDEVPDVACVPELAVLPDEELSGRYTAEIAWLRRNYSAGATLATTCSGAMLLAESGLLAGMDATTHWLFCDALARYPGVRVHPQRALVISGEGRIVMAGGGTSWQDLALYLVARFTTVEEAMRIARLFLIDWHDIGQQPFAALARSCQSEDAVIARCQTWAAEHYDDHSPVAAMMRLSGLTERNFHRRFKQATGMSPLEYVHTLRLEESKQLLETTDLPIETVANEVGYEDASFFGRLFRRQVGLTPAQYRKRFGALRKALQAGRANIVASPDG